MIRVVNARVILPDRELAQGSVTVDEDRIIAIDGTGSAHCQDIDCGGHWLLPGLIDLHCDAVEKEVAPRPSVLFPLPFAITQSDRKNALAGITTPFHAISFANDELGIRNNTTAAHAARTIHHHRGLVDNRVHCRYEITDAEGLEPLLALINEGAMDLLSFMDHTPGQGQFKSLDAYERYMMGAYKVSRDEARAAAQAKSVGAADALPRVEALAAAARNKGIPLASHDDDTPERVRTMQTLGGVMSEFPINLATAQAAHAAGLMTILGSPNVVRGGSQSGSMRALDAILDGCCDCLCADYHPATLLQAVMMLPQLGDISAVQAAALATVNPARAAGLSDRGEITVGKRADLILARFADGVATTQSTMVAGRLVLQAHAREHSASARACATA